MGANPRGRSKRKRRNPAELVLMAANPAGPTRKEVKAGEMYREFHGADPQHVDEYVEPSPRAATLTELGDLLEIRVKRTAGWKIGQLELTGQGIKLASNAKGTQLYCVGGDQRISRGQLTQLGVDNSKELIDLGEANYVAYRTRKSLAGGHLASYEHTLGEETGIGPRLMYDRRGAEPRLLFAGGEYHVEAAGIVN